MRLAYWLFLLYFIIKFLETIGSSFKCLVNSLSIQSNATTFWSKFGIIWTQFIFYLFHLWWSKYLGFENTPSICGEAWLLIILEFILNRSKGSSLACCSFNSSGTTTPRSSTSTLKIPRAKVETFLFRRQSYFFRALFFIDQPLLQISKHFYLISVCIFILLGMELWWISLCISKISSYWLISF